MAQLPAKRRRCAPFAASPSTSPGLKMSESKSSVFGETVSAPAKLTPGLFIFVTLRREDNYWFYGVMFFTIR